MLCPKCQHQERFTATISWLGYEDKNVLTCLSMKCPKCNTEMYDADDALVNILAELNKAGYATQFHCSVIHQDGYIVGSNPEYMPSQSALKHLRDSSGKTIYRGPYIIISGVDAYERSKLADVVSFQEDDDYCVFDFDNFPNHADISSGSIVMTTCCTGFDSPPEIRFAATKLSAKIREWLKRMDECGHVHIDPNNDMSLIANFSWSSHRDSDYDCD